MNQKSNSSVKECSLPDALLAASGDVETTMERYLALFGFPG
jgi:hypothetical protein